MNDEQLLRYSRHLLLDGLGFEGQQCLLGAHALVIGAGGLGSPALLYLASAGVGQITVVDDDQVDLSNLQRQIAHNQARIGLPKVESAHAAIAALNPEVHVNALAQRADAVLLDRLCERADVVLDCSDNYATRHLINAACVRHHKPLVSGAAIRWEAQVGVYDLRQTSAPCYACVFAPEAELEETRCATLGVLAPLVGVIGALQAGEALKLLVGAGQPLSGRLLMVDALNSKFEEMALQRRADCPVCGRH